MTGVMGCLPISGIRWSSHTTIAERGRHEISNHTHHHQPRRGQAACENGSKPWARGKHHCDDPSGEVRSGALNKADRTRSLCSLGRDFKQHSSRGLEQPSGLSKASSKKLYETMLPPHGHLHSLMASPLQVKEALAAGAALRVPQERGQRWR